MTDFLIDNQHLSLYNDNWIIDNLIIGLNIRQFGGEVMAKPDKSIDPRILESAKNEFLAHGYQDASLKTICANADVTTGALYKRYSGKAELFNAVVAPTIADMNEAVESRRIYKLGTLSDEKLMETWNMRESYMLWWFDFLYKRRDGFLLLINLSEGSEYGNFTHDWVQKMSDISYEYFLEARKRGLTDAPIDIEEMHILLSAFWTIIYEPFIHSYTWEQIVSHTEIVCRLFDWYKVLGFQV